MISVVSEVGDNYIASLIFAVVVMVGALVAYYYKMIRGARKDNRKKWVNDISDEPEIFTDDL